MLSPFDEFWTLYQDILQLFQLYLRQALGLALVVLIVGVVRWRDWWGKALTALAALVGVAVAVALDELGRL